jgi:alpha-tubulin suppressor-like RCC1 family protein
MDTRSFPRAGTMLLMVGGCADNAPSPTEPALSPAADVVAAATLTFRQLTTGAGHACGVTADGQVYCWGDARDGRLGTGTASSPETCHIDGVEFACSTRPIRVAGGLAFRQVSAGQVHTCGVTTDDRAFCWGWNGSGTLGTGTGLISDVPAPVAGGLRFRQVSAGWTMTCGITIPDDRIWCWGENYYGQLGDGTGQGSPTPVPIAGGHRWDQVDAGLGHACGVTAGNRAFCWGFNQFGQVGDSTEFRRRFRPRLVAGGLRFLYVEAGARHSCGVTTDRRAYCWGDGRDGQVGNNRTSLSFWPRRVAGGLSFERVTAGTIESCGLTTANRAYCWGDNSWGQLGDGTFERRLAPAAVAGGLAFAQLSLGHFFACGAADTGAGYCWGSNVFGGLGIGTNDAFGHPAPLPILDPI